MFNSEIVNYKEFLAKSRKAHPGPVMWRWSDILPKLEEAITLDPIDPGRSSVSLLNTQMDHGEVCQGLNALVQVLEPNTEGDAHRHSNFAIFIIKEGSGHSIIDGAKIAWTTGDIFIAPGWAEHQHINPSATERAILYTIQNVPTMISEGAWFFQSSNKGTIVRNVDE